MDYNPSSKVETDSARIKERLEKMQAQTAQGSVGYTEGPAQDMLTERLRSRKHRAQRESFQASRLDELLYLLEKHPEVARILDLLDAVRVDG